MIRAIRRSLVAVLCIGLAANAPVASAQTRPTDLAAITIEELMKIEITSVSRKEQRAEDVAAAVSVVTRDDIRRSGARTLPELFRLVPGVQVAQVNASNWAVSVRGFNELLSNKLLVLIDGRSIYSRASSGVFWNSFDLFIDDIERIEIVRGPGGTVWGANAVNGVINIVTKTAADTQGALVRAGGGTAGDAQGAVRYGGSIPNGHYRVYSQWSNHGQGLLDGGARANDSWKSLAHGFRLDLTHGSDTVTAQGSLVTGSARSLWNGVNGSAIGLPPAPTAPSTTEQTSLFGRWTHKRNEGSSLQIQAFMDRQVAALSPGNDQHENILDIDLQYNTKSGGRHDLIFGGGYRDANLTTTGSLTYTLTPKDSYNDILNLFGEDEISLGRSVKVTVGSKLEHDSVTSWGVQPTARAMWTVVPERHRVWTGVSRVLRTPSAHDLANRVNFAAFTNPMGVPIVLGTIGNPSYHAEEFRSLEGGYRLDLGGKASVDVTAFRGDYNHMQTGEPIPPVFETTPGRPHLFIATRLDNLLEVDTRGVEIAARWMPTASWRVDGSYSALHLTPRPDAASRDPGAASFDGAAPRHQWQLHSALLLGSRVELNAAFFHVGALREAAIPAYTRADARFEIKMADQLSLVLAGTNLFDREHLEFGGPTAIVTPTLVPRRATAQLLWRFK